MLTEEKLAVTFSIVLMLTVTIFIFTQASLAVSSVIQDDRVGSQGQDHPFVFRSESSNI
jgi:hypothetical protein